MPLQGAMICGRYGAVGGGAGAEGRRQMGAAPVTEGQGQGQGGVR